jgi:hypothetical protein
MQVHVQYVGDVVVRGVMSTVGDIRTSLAVAIGTRPSVLRFRHRSEGDARVLRDDEPAWMITDAFQVPTVCEKHTHGSGTHGAKPTFTCAQ